ncbi:TPA: cytoplasmic protein, partial [Escherichia coli]|nr:cytoplasmic protein [Escherichia coli]
GDDRVEKPEGVIAQPSQPEHPVIKGFSEYPFFLGYNRAIAKENAEVVLTINNAPLLVFGNYHNGKIACFMSDHRTGVHSSLCPGRSIPRCG